MSKTPQEAPENAGKPSQAEIDALKVEVYNRMRTLGQIQASIQQIEQRILELESAQRAA